MVFHSLLSPNNSDLHPHLSNSFFYPEFYKCFKSVNSSTIFVTFTCTSVLLLLPLSARVFFEGIHRWWKQRHVSTVTVSHSDFLAYNIITMEQIGLIASVYYCCGMFTDQPRMMKAAVYIVFIVYLGRLLFQCLTCVEQYLAVIYPVTFMSLKTERGIRVRNTNIGCIWLLCLATLVFVVLFSPELPIIPFFMLFAVGLLVISFCSLSVIFALIRSGPGEVGGDRKRVDQSKKKALLTVLAITVVMFVKYLGLLVCISLHASSALSYDDACVLLMSSFWFCLPSSLSLPLLFLYRAGKLPCIFPKAD